MSHQINMDAPYVLATLPRALSSETSRTYASVVRTYKPSRWRRRPEIVTAVDGEGIYIYHVEGSHTQRYTYAAVSEDRDGPVRIVCFIEEHSNSATLGDLSTHRLVKHSYAPRLAASPIINITAISGKSGGPALWQPSVVLVHKDGSCECVDSRLETSHWTYQGSRALDDGTDTSDKSSASEVSFVTFTELDSARKGFLKGRTDALANLERLFGSQDTAAQQSLMIMITTSTAGDRPLTRRVHCLALPMTVTEGALGALRQPEQVLSYALPGPPRDYGHLQYNLHITTGILFQLLPGSLVSWDLSGVLPQQHSTIPNASRDFQSLAVISSSLVAAFSGSACRLLDTTHCSQQAVQQIAVSDASEKNRRSSRDLSAKVAMLQSIGHFAELGLLVALHRNRLLAFPMTTRSTSRHRSHAESCLLADAYCKGLPEVPKGRTSQASGRPDAVKDVEWNEWKKTIDQLAEAGDVDHFEKFLAREMSIPRQKIRMGTNEDHDANADPNDAANANADLESHAWQFPRDNSKLVGRTRKRKALHCLRKIFILDSESNDGYGLSIALYAQEVLVWLAMTGFLSAAAVQEAFSEENEHRVVRIAKGALARAFVELDPTLGVLHDFLNQPIHIDAEEVVQALQAVVRSLESPMPDDVAQKLLSSGTDTANATTEAAAEDAIAVESRAAEADLAFALASLNDGIAVRSELLGVIFSRLICHPPDTITRLFRKHLSEKETIFLITLLRIELADGGWTTRYQDEPDEGDATEGVSNRSISTIARLLNMAVDAIGISGWLVGMGGDSGVSTGEMLLVLRAEIAAALEGCSEAEILKVQLNDFEKFTRAVEQTQSRRGKKRKFGHQDEEESPLLPMGCKVDTIETTTVSKGGKIREKSANAMRKEMSMKVGRYTIDRIRV